jgi:hypothetical protein
MKEKVPEHVGEREIKSFSMNRKAWRKLAAQEKRKRRKAAKKEKLPVPAPIVAPNVHYVTTRLKGNRNKKEVKE